MSNIANYSFLPWLRQGVANAITAADGEQNVKTRASIHVELTLKGNQIGGGAKLTQEIAQDVLLYGPGDIIGIDTRAIVRTEPRNWITNFESNYLPFVEFYDEDFPWRYTPAGQDPSGLRLRPWIALVVLAESEFQEGQNIANRPLPFITVPDPSVFPPADDLWAWAHVHFNESLAGSDSEIVSPDMTAVIPRVQTILAQNPDLAYSRIVCPRRLADNTPYHAFVIPVFETGRLAGMGLDPAKAPFATFSAWAPYGGRLEPTNYPIYYRWYFRTGTVGDFEYLVRLLQPRPVDPRVGYRDMDVQNPDPDIPGIQDPALGGILRLGGALRVPLSSLSPPDLADFQKYDNWAQPYPHPFQKALAAFINLADGYSSQNAAAANAATNPSRSNAGPGPGIYNDPDPLITPPLYGRWHALTARLLTNRDGTTAVPNNNWVHQLSLDPRYRVAAAFGAQVVESNQEAYMNAAWEQIGEVLEANRRLRRLQLGKQVSWRWYDRHVNTLAAANSERAFTFSAPVAPRVLVNGSTVQHLQTTSLVAPTLTSTLMRRVIRPGGRMIRTLPFDATAKPTNLLARINAGTVSAAPPKVVPPGVPTLDQIAGAIEPPGAPVWVLELLRRFPWLPQLVLAIAVAVALLLLALHAGGVVLTIGLLIIAALLALDALLVRWEEADAPAQAITEENQTPGAVDEYPLSPDFVLAQPGSSVRPTTGTADSRVAVRFKNGLRDSFALLEASKAVSIRPAPVTLDLPSLTASMVAAIDPTVTILRRGLSLIAIPPRILGQIGDSFNEVMAYPRLDLPMYEPLKAISVELFLPNLNLVPQNSVTLLETNQKFIESYIVGLNHEFARKLLWREYPTDERGSYFRQFWDVRSFFNANNSLTREQLYDVPELHRWDINSNLGEHNNRASQGQMVAEAVLVIRGELLKRYPTAVIFAQKAEWARNSDGNIDLSKPRTLVNIPAAEQANPPRTKVRTPLYEAKADPDIYFFGFDLTIAEAKGGTGDNPNDDPGWFFVIKERPGEPRFGLELDRRGNLETFEDLTWNDALPGAAPGDFLPANNLSAVTLVAPSASEPEKQHQYADDVQADAATVSSARWAYMLFRAPVMVAIHADELLSNP